MDSNILYKSISENIAVQIEILLKHIHEDMRGHTFKIKYEGEGISFIGDFLRNEMVMINIEYEKHIEDDRKTIGLTVYRLFEKEGFELCVYLCEENRLYNLIPVKIRNGMIACAETETDIEVIL